MRNPLALGPPVTLVSASLALAVSSIACEQTAPAPLAEALVVVDTDLPIAIATRLRVDLYTENGSWYESRDIARPETDDWPASFSVFSPDGAPEAHLLVRLRTYPEGFVRDYRGERFVEVDDLDSSIPNDDALPRLMHGTTDATPTTEPLPTVAVDRLVRLHLVPGTRGRARVTLRGACAGTMAKLSDTPEDKPRLDQVETCIATEGKRQKIDEAALDPDMSTPAATHLGDFARGRECTEHPPAESRAQCIGGGVFVLGDPSSVGFGGGLDAIPPRIKVVDRFWLDRRETTVQEIRAAIAAGFSLPAAITPHEGEIAQSVASDAYVADSWCTYSAAPRGREDLPINCIPWETGRAYCQWLGGDLPTEAQWEFAAGWSGRARRTDFPWGNEPATCDRLVFGRTGPNGRTAKCADYPPQPQPPGSTAGDVTIDGIFDMGGNVTELVRDEWAAYTDLCWTASVMSNPLCTRGRLGGHGARGSEFRGAAFTAGPSWRGNDITVSQRAGNGLRCEFDQAPRPRP